MVLNRLGKGSGPRVVSKGGQRIFIYDKENYFAFILEKGLMYKAGKNQSYGGAWPNKVESGQLNPEGIGLNKKLYKAVMKTRNNRDFYVYDKTEGRFYKLVDYDLLAQNSRPQKINGKTLILTPFDAYTKIFNEHELDQQLRKLKSKV